MSKINEAILGIHEIDIEALKRREKSGLHPLSILLVTLVFIGVTGSFGKYSLSGLCSMAVFLIFISIVQDISIIKGFRRLKYILVFMLVFGLVNPLLNQEIVANIQIGAKTFAVSAGFISMITLWIKGIFMVYAVYFMIIQIGIEGLGQALSALHTPGIIITIITIIYRYIILLLREVERMWTAYHMRAPGQKGINVKAWGSFAGLLLFRSLDRAENVYGSMLLRGYDENRGIPIAPKKTNIWTNLLYVILWIGIFVLFRNVPIFTLVGEFFG